MNKSHHAVLLIVCFSQSVSDHVDQNWTVFLMLNWPLRVNSSPHFCLCKKTFTNHEQKVTRIHRNEELRGFVIQHWIISNPVLCFSLLENFKDEWKVKFFIVVLVKRLIQAHCMQTHLSFCDCLHRSPSPSLFSSHFCHRPSDAENEIFLSFLCLTWKECSSLCGADLTDFFLWFSC